jgi:GH18 family chitinase
MAIPGGEYYGKHYDLKTLSQFVGRFLVMAYDYSGSWSDRSDPFADGWTTLEYLEKLQEKVDMSKIVMGYPSYGVLFEKGTEPGGKYQTKHTKYLAYKDVKTGDIENDDPGLTTWAYPDSGGIISLLSPKEIKEVRKKIKNTYGKKTKGVYDGSTFMWQLGNAIPSQIDAIAD